MKNIRMTLNEIYHNQNRLNTIANYKKDPESIAKPMFVQSLNYESKKKKILEQNKEIFNPQNNKEGLFQIDVKKTVNQTLLNTPLVEEAFQSHEKFQNHKKLFADLLDYSQAFQKCMNNKRKQEILDQRFQRQKDQQIQKFPEQKVDKFKIQKQTLFGSIMQRIITDQKKMKKEEKIKQDQFQLQKILVLKKQVQLEKEKQKELLKLKEQEAQSSKKGQDTDRSLELQNSSRSGDQTETQIKTNHKKNDDIEIKDQAQQQRKIIKPTTNNNIDNQQNDLISNEYQQQNQQSQQFNFEAHRPSKPQVPKFRRLGTTVFEQTAYEQIDQIIQTKQEIENKKQQVILDEETRLAEGKKKNQYNKLVNQINNKIQSINHIEENLDMRKKSEEMQKQDINKNGKLFKNQKHTKSSKQLEQHSIIKENKEDSSVNSNSKSNIQNPVSTSSMSNQNKQKLQEQELTQGTIKKSRNKKNISKEEPDEDDEERLKQEKLKRMNDTRKKLGLITFSERDQKVQYSSQIKYLKLNQKLEQQQKEIDEFDLIQRNFQTSFTFSDNLDYKQRAITAKNQGLRLIEEKNSYYQQRTKLGTPISKQQQRVCKTQNQNYQNTISSFEENKNFQNQIINNYNYISENQEKLSKFQPIAGPLEINFPFSSKSDHFQLVTSNSVSSIANHFNNQIANNQFIQTAYQNQNESRLMTSESCKRGQTKSQNQSRNVDKLFKKYSQQYFQNKLQETFLTKRFTQNIDGPKKVVHSVKHKVKNFFESITNFNDQYKEDNYSLKQGITEAFFQIDEHFINLDNQLEGQQHQTDKIINQGIIAEIKQNFT